MGRGRKKMLLVSVTRSRHPRYPWKLTWRENGARRQRWLATESEARAVALVVHERLRQVGEDVAPVTPGELRAVLDARAAGVDLAEAVREFVRVRELRGTGKTVAETVAARLAEAERAGRSEIYRKNLASVFKRVVEAMGHRRLAEVTPEDVAEFVYGLKVAPRSQAHALGYLVSLFRFAERRRWVTGNAAAAVARPRLPPERPGILTVEAARHLLTCCGAEIRPAVGIQLFAGLRHAEVLRLDWREVNVGRGFVEVSAAKSKTATRRLVAILPPLRRILEGMPAVPECGPVWPRNGARLWDAALVAAGYRGRWGANAKGQPWPPNALRHSFASYHLAHFQDAARTALELGHMTTRLLFAHYRELVSPEEAARFWS